MNLLYILIIAGLIVIVLLVWIILSNKLKRAVIKIDEAFSDIDVALAKRYEILTKMVEVVKGYVKHEKEIMLEIVKLRNDSSIEEKNKANKMMDKNYYKINAIAENYPKLKANENFIILQQSIVDVEEHLQASRRVYNSNVSIYNQLVDSFPTNIIAKKKGMSKKEFFEANELEKENVSVEIKD